MSAVVTDSILLTLGLGFLLGLKHATEADHLAAVSTFVSESRSLWRSAEIGFFWGLGHTAALLVAGGGMIVFGVTLPESVARTLEFAVALMIILLGSRILFLALRHRRRVHAHWHVHDGKRHFHLHFHGRDAHLPASSHTGPHTGLVGWRPILVGMVHGLAGSAALTLLVLTEITQNGSVLVGFGYLLVFGAGSIGGMLVMSILIGLPFTLGSRFLERSVYPLHLAAGTLSTLFGLFYAWETFKVF